MDLEILAVAQPEDFLALYPRSIKNSVREAIVKHAYDAISSALLGNSVIFLAKHGGETVGIAELIVKSEDLRLANRRDRAHVFNFHVREDVRRRGVGSLLMAALIREAGMRGVKVLSLIVERSNKKALSLYRRLGFAIVEHLVLDDEPVFLMQKTLEPPADT